MEEYNLWNQIPHQIRKSADKQNHLCFKRHRRSDAFSIVASVIKLVADPNNSYLSTLRMLAEVEVPLSSSAFCEARKKVPSYVFAEIMRDLRDLKNSIRRKAFDWYNFRVFAADGSWITVPRSLEQEGFYKDSKAYYPQGLLTVLFEIADRTIYSMDFSEQFDERKGLKRCWEGLGAGDLLIYDAGYLSYQFLLEHLLKGVHGLFRVQEGHVFNEIQAFRESKLKDQRVFITPSLITRQKARKVLAIDPLPTLEIRLIKHRIKNENCVFATTCLREDIPAKAFRDLYWKRWKIEEIFKVCKQRLQIEDFHSKNRNGVEQELYAAGILWNVTRMMEIFDSKKTSKTRSRPSQTNFTQVLRIFSTTLKDFFSGCEARIRNSFEFCLAHLKRSKLPIRPHRSYPRFSMSYKKKWTANPQKRPKRGAPIGIQA